MRVQCLCEGKTVDKIAKSIRPARAGWYGTILWPLLERVVITVQSIILSNSILNAFCVLGSLHALFHLIFTHMTIIRCVGYSGSRTQTHAF